MPRAAPPVHPHPPPIPLHGHTSARDFGGMLDSEGPMTQPGATVGIGVMVRVTDADTISARAAQLRSRGAPAFDIGSNGRMAECYDPSNANVDLWQPRGEKGTAFPGMEPPYINCSLGERMVAGMMGITPEMPGVPPHWMPYFTATDADATA